MPEQAEWFAITYILFGLAAVIVSIETAVFRTAIWRRLRYTSAKSRLASLKLLIGASIGEAVAGLCLVLSGPGILRLLVLLTIVILQSADTVGLRTARDGSDSILSILGVGLIVLQFEEANSAKFSTILYIAATALLVYFISGLAKLLSTEWRSGRAFYSSTATAVAGRTKAKVKRRVDDSRFVAKAASWTVIALEVAAPATLLLPTVVAVVYLGILLLFHVGTALIMKLTGFLYVMPCFYPSIVAANLVIGTT